MRFNKALLSCAISLTLGATSVQASSELESHFEFDSAVSGSSNQAGSFGLSEVHIPVRFFVSDTTTVGLEGRYWSPGYYPLARDGRENTGPVWSAGPSAQVYLFLTKRWGGYLGGSFLWVPTQSQVIVSPEAGVKFFVSSRAALGISYHIISDLPAYLFSFEPSHASGSRQSLAAELSFFLGT